MHNYILVFLGSGLGGILRYGISEWMKKYCFILPIHTLIANLMACMMIGFFIGKFQNENSAKLFLAVGICGGLSTFSTFSLENIKYLESNDWTSFFAYTFLSLIGCLVATWLGFFLWSKFDF